MEPRLPGTNTRRQRNPLAQSLIDSKRDQIVDKIMVDVITPKFESWVGRTFGARSRNNEKGRPASNRGTTSGGGAPRKGTGGQKRQRQRDESDESQDEKRGDGNGGNRKTLKRAKTEPEPDKRLACPFYKHNPVKYQNHRTCCGPGWKDTHRMK